MGAGRSAEGETGGGAGLDGVRLLAAEPSSAVVFVALGIAAGEGEGGLGDGAGLALGVVVELLEEVEEVVGVLAGGIEAEGEGNGRMASGDVFEALTELGVAVGGLGEGQFVGGGGLEVGAKEGGSSGRSGRCRCRRRWGVGEWLSRNVTAGESVAIVSPKRC